MDDEEIQFTPEFEEPLFIHIKEDGTGFPEIDTNIASFAQAIGLLTIAVKLFEREALNCIKVEE